MFYMSAWLDNEKSLQNTIPLELLGESIQRYKSTLKFNIVILEGYEFLSKSYFNKLENLGFEIIDYVEEFKKIIEQFPSINDYHSHFERNCFLRWIAFKNILKKNELENNQFWHLDGDIILHSSLDDIADDTRGKTFVLQGCPALVSVSDFQWFEIYGIELHKLDNDIFGYSAIANNKKQECKNNDHRLCNYSVFRNPIGSDQDFLEYLISSEIIIQNKSIEIYNSSFFFAQNILEFTDWNDFQNIEGASVVKDMGGGELVYAGKKIAYIHYTNSFCRYANIYAYTKKMGLFNTTFAKYLLNYKIEGSELKLSLIAKIGYKIAKKLKLNLSRNDVILFLMKTDKKVKEMYIAQLMNFMIKYRCSPKKMKNIKRQKMVSA